MIGSYVDIILILVILYNIWRGWESGFVIGLVDLISWVGSLLAAFWLYDRVAGQIGALLESREVLAQPVAFAIVAIVAGLLLSILGRSFVTRIPVRLHRHQLNRILGVLPGLVNGLVVIAILSAVLLALPLSGDVLEATRDSRMANRFASLTDRVEGELASIFGEAISETLNLMTIHPDSEEIVELPYTVTDAEPAPALEARMLEMVNAERARAGLAPLKMDKALTEVARRHSRDMFERGYFSHSTPEGLSPFDRIQAGGVEYRTAGENLAHASTLEIAHNGLMNSPGHRANILRPQFGRVGIGILDGGARGLMITQNFRD